MNKTEVLKILQSLPSEISKAETDYYNHLNNLRILKNKLAVFESDLYKAGKVKGSSDKVRTLQLIQLTKDIYADILRAEFNTDIALIELNRVKNEYDTAQLVANLIIS